MSTTSVQLKLTLQALDDNPDTWGTVLNTGAIELLEDAIAGLSQPDVTLGNVTMDTTAGGDDPGNEHYRKMIAEITGAPGDDLHTVAAPDLTGIWIVYNNTSDSSDVTFKTATGAGIPVPAGETYVCFSDGTDMLTIDVANATNATLAATATNALSLGGDLASLFPRLATNTAWTSGQSVTRVTLVDDGGDLKPNMNNSNTFYHEMLQGQNLVGPTNPVNGSAFSLVVVQGTGAPWTLTFQASTFIWASATVPTLSTVVGDVDYFAFEYVTGLPAPISGNRWVGSIIKDASE